MSDPLFRGKKPLASPVRRDDAERAGRCPSLSSDRYPAHGAFIAASRIWSIFPARCEYRITISVLAPLPIADACAMARQVAPARQHAHEHGLVQRGRDHNADAFSVWLAGAGSKRGIAYGTSDDIGWKAAENPVDVYDFHAPT